MKILYSKRKRKEIIWYLYNFFLLAIQFNNIKFSWKYIIYKYITLVFEIEEKCVTIFLEAIIYYILTWENVQVINILDPSIPRFQFYFCHTSDAEMNTQIHIKMVTKSETASKQPENGTSCSKVQ